MNIQDKKLWNHFHKQNTPNLTDENNQATTTINNEYKDKWVLMCILSLQNSWWTGMKNQNGTTVCKMDSTIRRSYWDQKCKTEDAEIIDCSSRSLDIIVSFH